MKTKKIRLTLSTLFKTIAITTCLLVARGAYSQDKTAPEAAPELARNDETGWNFAVDAYLWAAGIDIGSAAGGSAEIGFDEIIQNLDMAVMTSFAAKKDRLTLLVDMIYLDLKHDDDETLTKRLKMTDLEIQALVVQPIAAWTVIDEEHFNLDVLGGARYLWLDVDVSLERDGRRHSGKGSGSKDGDVWNGIAGIRGSIKLDDHWYIPYHLDAGTGETKLTYQALALLCYQFEHVSVGAGYRYLAWEFDDSDTGGEVFDDLTISGPMIGLSYNF